MIQHPAINWHLFLAFCHHFIHRCTPAWNQILLRQYWNELNGSKYPKSNSTKYWMSYIEKMIQGGINRTSINRTGDITSMLNGIIVVKNLKLARNSSCEKVNSGKRLILAEVRSPRNITGAGKKEISYILTPYVHLRMNLTFIELRLVGALQCLSGRKKRWPPFEFRYPLAYIHRRTNVEFVEYVNIVQECRKHCDWKPQVEEMLCGHYPSHVRFLLYPKTILTFSPLSGSNSKLTMQFQIILIDFAVWFNLTCFWIRCPHTIPTPPTMETILDLFVIRHHQQIVFHSFRIATNRANSLLLYQNTSSQALIFDGPSFESEIIKVRQTGIGLVFGATSFLATILVIREGNQNISHVQHHFQYYSLPADNKINYTAENISTSPHITRKKGRGHVLMF